MINLLPWRTQLRRRQQHEWAILLVGITCLAATILTISHRVLLTKVRTQESYYHRWQAEKKPLEQELLVYQRQQQSSLRLVQGGLLLHRLHLDWHTLLTFSLALTQRMPGTVYLTQLTATPKQILLTGVARRPHAVTALLPRLEAMPTVATAKLLNNQRQSQTTDVVFKVLLTLKTS